MAMEINSNYKDYKSEDWEKVQTEQDKTQRVDKEQEERKDKGIPIPKDEYISSEKSGSKPSGLYSIGQDESGNPKVLFDDPKKAAKGKEIPMEEEPAQKEPAQKEEECTTNTDEVDRELERLKEEKKQLEQQINAAMGDEEKMKQLENKLRQIDGELSQKDNDAYRRQNAIIS